MSTRKILGTLAAGAASKLMREGSVSKVGFVNFYIADAKDSDTPAVLIIGGKGYTVEEVRAFIADLKDQTMSIAVEQSIDRIAAKHGITIP